MRRASVAATLLILCACGGEQPPTPKIRVSFATPYRLVCVTPDNPLAVEIQREAGAVDLPIDWVCSVKNGTVDSWIPITSSDET